MRPDEPLIRFDWIARNLGEIGQRVGEHLVMTLVAVGIGFVISFALALAIRRWRSLAGPVLAVSGVLYTIPSLGLFALLIPITGLSIVSAEIALVSYTLLILVRNILAGLESVPAEVSEAAIGMGYTPWQRLWAIELPIAVPIIVAGVRIATVTTIGLVTVTSLIGQGGLGYFIVVVGIRQFFPTAIYVGAGLSIALALVADLALLALQAGLTPWARARGTAG
ncbi:MAG TPA: ABC transporter permease [Candidatus Limnocylindria bacterium]|nr:ABC transporter permease [Candidatus Limnocylindria bacterium]